MKKTLSVGLVLGLLVGSASFASAISLDLTTAGASGFIGDAFFQQVPDQSTGTGVIEPFLRIQATGTESGYNTDGTVVFDTKAGAWTHSLLLSAVPIVNIEGIDYRQFLLDINQNRGGTGELLSLNILQLYLGTNRFVTGEDLSQLGTMVYDLGDNVIELNYMLNPGSGAGDMFAYIPNSVFTGSNPYLFMYSGFGNPNPSNDGFEEWAIVGTSTPIPEPATMLLFGTGLIGLAGIGRKKRS